MVRAEVSLRGGFSHLSHDRTTPQARVLFSRQCASGLSVTHITSPYQPASCDAST